MDQIVITHHSQTLFIHIYYPLLQTMGNKNICGNFQNEQRPPLNAIAPAYDLNEQTTFKAVKPQYLKYPQKFPYILTQMQQRNLKFVDEYFNCIMNEQKVVGDQFYAYYNVIQITWKRSNQLVQTQQHKVTDRINHQNINKVSPIHKILYWIMEQPKLIKQIFRFEEIAKEGLVLLYLPYYGSQKNPIEIVIDNYLPTNHGSYVVPIPKYSTVGMLLLEKGLAKLLGSYQALKSKSGREIFEIVVGIPIIFQGLGLNGDEVTILSKFYNPFYKVASIQQQLISKHSQYMRINIVKPTNMSISIWQIDQNQRENKLNKHSEIILELIKKDTTPGSFSRVAYASKLWENKTILKATSPQDESIKNSKQFLVLEEGDYYLHIFSQSDKNIIIANIIVYSEFEVNLLFRKDSHDLNQIKRVMICNIFKMRESLKSLQEFPQCYNIKSKFLWDGYRGILCLNCINKSGQNVIKIQILPEYRKKIKFQESNEFQMDLELLHSNKIVTFIKLSRDIGRFYKITLANR